MPARRKPRPERAAPAVDTASPPARNRVTVHLPVSVTLTDDELADAATVNEAVGVAVKLANTPEIRALGVRLFELARRRLGKR